MFSGTIADSLLDDSPSAVFLPSAFGYLNVEKLDDVHCNYADASLHSMGGSIQQNRSSFGKFSFLENLQESFCENCEIYHAMLSKNSSTTFLSD